MLNFILANITVQTEIIIFSQSSCKYLYKLPKNLKKNIYIFFCVIKTSSGIFSITIEKGRAKREKFQSNFVEIL